MVRTLRLSCIAPLLLGAACDAGNPNPPFDYTPSVVLLLGRDPLPIADADSTLLAFLVTTGTPGSSPYLVADQFTMRRVSDGMVFDWTAIAPPRDTLAVWVPFASKAGNYALAWNGSANRGGRADVTISEEYELTIDAGSQHISGRTHIPGRVQFLPPMNNDSTVRWHKVPGAGSYLVGLDSTCCVAPIGDTVFNVRNYLRPNPYGTPAATSITIVAVDSNYTAFFIRSQAGSAGLVGAHGVFGSYTWAQGSLAQLVPSQPPTMP
jgi:hypothetical protein